MAAIKLQKSQAAARLEHTSDLSQGRRGLGKMVKSVQQQHAIHRGVAQRQMRRVTACAADAPTTAPVTQHGRAVVHNQHLAANAIRGRSGANPGTTTDIQYTVTACQR